MSWTEKQRKAVKLSKKLWAGSSIYQFRGVPKKELENRMMFNAFRTIWWRSEIITFFRKLRKKQEINKLLLSEQITDSCIEDGYLKYHRGNNDLVLTPKGEKFIEWNYWVNDFLKHPLIANHLSTIIIAVIIGVALFLGISFKEASNSIIFFKNLFSL